MKEKGFGNLTVADFIYIIESEHEILCSQTERIKKKFLRSVKCPKLAWY